MTTPIPSEDATAIATAAAFYFEEAATLLHAIYLAEGGHDAFIRAIRCSKKDVHTIEKALAYGCKTVRSRIVAAQEFHVRVFEAVESGMLDPWTGEPAPRRLLFTEDFIEFLGARWAPVGADNDPGNLNANWVENVYQRYRALAMDAYRGRPAERSVPA